MSDPNHLFVLQFENPIELHNIDLPSDARALAVLCVAAQAEDAKQISTLLHGTMQQKGLVKCVTHNNIVVAGFTNMLLHELKTLPRTQIFSTVNIKVCSAGVAAASTSMMQMYKCKISNHIVTKEFVDSLVTKSVGGMFIESSAPSGPAPSPSSTQEEINQLLHSLTLAQKRPIGSAAPTSQTTNKAEPVQQPISTTATASSKNSPKYKKRYQITPQEPVQQQTVMPFQFTPDVQSILVFQQQQQHHHHQLQQLNSGMHTGMLPFHGGIVGFPPTFHALQTMGVPMASLTQPMPAQFSFSQLPIQGAMSAGMIPTLHSIGPMSIPNTLSAPACTPAWKMNNVDSKLSPYAPPFQAAPLKAGGKGKKGRSSPTATSNDSSPMSGVQWLQQPQWKATIRFKRNTGEYMSLSKYEKDCYVIVDGDRGLDLGVVESCWLEGEASPVAGGSKISGSIVRAAENHEIEEHTKMMEEEAQCLNVVNEKVKAHNLDMQVWDVAFQFDKQKLTVFYTAPDRQDFRNLCRELYKLYHARIWFELLKEEQQAQGHPYFVKRDKKTSKKEKLQSKSPSGSTGSVSPSYTEPLPTSSNACSPMSIAEDSPGDNYQTPTADAQTPCAGDAEDITKPHPLVQREEYIPAHAHAEPAIIVPA